MIKELIIMDENLKKEAEALVSQGYNDIQIKQSLTSKGYTIQQIDEALRTPVVDIKKGNNNVIITSIIVILLIAVISLGIFLLSKSDAFKYSDNPKNWIDDGANGVKTIDVAEATKGAGSIDEIGLQYEKGNISTVFGYDGIYEGKIFYDSEYKINDTVKLRITNNLTPKNNIPEAYIIESIENNKVIAHIFVDDDWKDIVGESNIIWGADYQNSKPFVFKEIKTGVYYDTVIDDSDRFFMDYKKAVGGIIIGKVTLEQINNNDLSKATFIRVF